MKDSSAHQDTYYVIGGGIAGLISAIEMAEQGLPVKLLEKSQHLGGRAHSTEHQQHRLNLGPHALYKGLELHQTILRLGLDLELGKAAAEGYVLDEDQLHRLPAGPVTLMGTSLLGMGQKWALGKLLGLLPKVKAAEYRALSAEEWIQNQTLDPKIQRLLRAIVRLTTYCNSLERLSAEAAITQMQHGLEKGVFYIENGWKSLIDALENKARKAGVEIITASAVRKINQEGEEIYLQLDQQAPIQAAGIVLAIPPKSAKKILPDGFKVTSHQLEQTRPVHAGCLDLSLSSLPNTQYGFGLGLDTPLYFSVHSKWTSFGPKDSACIHAAYYQGENAPSAAQIENCLKKWTDRLQPGWREMVVKEQFLPQIVVTHDLPRPGDSYQGRCPVVSAESAQICFVGDWVGNQGMLADASAASALQAGQHLAKYHQDRCLKAVS